MNFSGFVDLCSDEVIEVKDVRHDVESNIAKQKAGFNTPNQAVLEECRVTNQGFEDYGNLYGLSNSAYVTGLASLYANRFCQISASPVPVQICTQFWKAGDYEAGQSFSANSQNGQNRLRVHPKFLHSNATSHKWAFGAIAELLDNAVDEVQKGATFVSIDQITNTRDGSPALLIQDDGGGMDPESLRHCMSFGFSDKHSDSSIGQYGNGFKTSTMRLGADVIVFTRCRNERNITQSVGLLSYTFLRRMGYDDIIVPMVDYHYDPLTGVSKRILRHGQKQFFSNMSILLSWTPFMREADLLKQFDNMGDHGTKVVVFNLWYNDYGEKELDFDTDVEDITISGAFDTGKTMSKSNMKMITQNHIANKLRCSLRVYSSVLYLHLPESFKIILRRQVVEPHYLVNDLRFRECIRYKPQVGANIEHTVITTIGFLEGAPYLNIHGFNVYHRNRLILPFWPVVCNTNGKGRGVAGVLEVNFLKPTHDKQDFEKSSLCQRLEIRLKDMALEYWDYHCHLVGYTSKKITPPVPRPTVHPSPDLGSINGVQEVTLTSHPLPLSVSDARSVASGAARDLANISPYQLATSKVVPTTDAPVCSPQDPGEVVTAPSGPICSSPRQSFHNRNISSHTELPKKRRYISHNDAIESSNEPAVAAKIIDIPESKPKFQKPVKGMRIQRLKRMIYEHKKLQTECLELEKVEIQLLLKEQNLINELQEVRHAYEDLLVKMKLLDETKVEKS